MKTTKTISMPENRLPSMWDRAEWGLDGRWMVNFARWKNDRSFYALLWKDLRLASPLLIAGFTLAGLAFLAMIAQYLDVNQFQSVETYRNELFRGFSIATMISAMISQLVIISFGSHSVTDERKSGGMEFLFGLPPTRQRIAFSKLTSSAAIMGFVLAWHAGLLHAMSWYLERPSHWELSMPVIWYASLVGFGCFGIAWCSASILGRADYAFGIAVTLPPVFLLILYWLDQPVFQHFTPEFICRFFGIAGVSGILTGTFWFVRRQEP